MVALRYHGGAHLPDVESEITLRRVLELTRLAVQLGVVFGLTSLPADLDPRELTDIRGSFSDSLNP